MCDSDSSSRLTLEPLSRVGSSDVCTLGVTEAGDCPFLTALLSASSNLTLRAWYPGVSMFAMLSAMAVWRADNPATATRSEDDETSSNTAGSLRHFLYAGPWRVVSNPCSYPPIRRLEESAERQTVAAG